MREGGWDGVGWGAVGEGRCIGMCQVLLRWLIRELWSIRNDGQLSGPDVFRHFSLTDAGGFGAHGERGGGGLAEEGGVRRGGVRRGGGEGGLRRVRRALSPLR